MTTWLSDDWLDAVASLTDALPVAGASNGVVDLAIGVAPRRDVHLHWEYADGRPASGATGAADGPDLSLSISSGDAAAVLSGQVEPSVAFMRGRLKSAGDGRLMMAVLASLTGPDYEGWRRRVAAVGDIPAPTG